jgi:hypothetical protein
MIRVLLLAICLFSTAPVFASDLTITKPEEEGMSSERLQRLSAGLQRYIDQGELAGSVVLIARHGKVVHFEAQGIKFPCVPTLSSACNR